MSVTVIDGGFGTLLARYLGGSVDSDPLWSARSLADNPDIVCKVHLEFARAGAQVIRTNSYQASIGGFSEHLGLSEEDGILLIKKSVELARKAINAFITEQLELDEIMMPPLVVGSVGPYGAALHDGSEYRGEYGSTITEEQLMAWHRPRLRALDQAGVRLLAVETIPCLAEAKAVLRLLKLEFPHLRTWVSFSCKDDQHISEGTKFVDAARECWKLGSSQLEAVGVNCLHPMWVTPLLRSVHQVEPSMPLIAYPNSGETWKPDLGWLQSEHKVPISSYVGDWLKLGARYVGGCCRTYPEDTKQIFAAVQKLTN